ncbi:hypothetical protein OAJ58_00895 [Nitrosopumilus sp.]|jgi:hypothetical protein|nr:hypothetical protein [Nitrosopumilus sp.]
MQNTINLMTVEWKNKIKKIKQTKLSVETNYLLVNFQKKQKSINGISEVKNNLKYSLHS